MKILNIRKGFATNSSSSHSFLFLKEGVKPQTDEYEDFGWGYFTAADKESKENYFFALVKNNLRGMGLSDQQTDDFLKNVFPDTVFDKSAGVDHQSIVMFPKTWDGKQLNQEFLKDFKKFLENERVVILGGNDNDDKQHDLLKSGSLLQINEIPKEYGAQSLVAKKDGINWIFLTETMVLN